MSGLDYFFMGVTGLSLLVGFLRGAIRSLWGFLAAIIGLVFASIWYADLARLIRADGESELLAALVAFLVIFMCTIMAGLVMSHSFRRMLRKAHLGWVDHLAGGAVGFLRGWVICSIIYMAMTAFPIQPRLISGARLSPYLQAGGRWLAMVTSREFRTRYLEELQSLQARWDFIHSGN